MSEYPKESSINDKEKKWIAQTTAIVHEVLKEHSDSKRKKFSDILKHPLLLLFIGALASGVIVFEYQGRHMQIAERVKAKYELLKEISVVTGKLLAMAEEILNLHQKPIKSEEQIIATNKAYNEASEVYSSNFAKIEYSLRIIFKRENIIKGWGEIRAAFKELNDSLDLLHEFKTIDISQEHSKRIDRCKNKTLDVTDKLNQFARSLIENLD